MNDKVWKDHKTTELVNDLRDCVLEYQEAEQLRERIAYIITPLTNHLGCLDEWFEKTNWVQDTVRVSELGMHRADVLKKRIELLSEEIKGLNRLLLDSELVLDAAKEEITKQTNRAAIAEQQLEQMISRWKTANALNTAARNELAKIKLENNL